MHIRTAGLQGIWHAPVSPASSIAASNVISPATSVGAVSAISIGQSDVAPINGGSLFQSMLSELMRQQSLTVTGSANGQTSDSFQGFLQALNQSLTAGQVASTPASSADATTDATNQAGRSGRAGLEKNIQSLIGALGASNSGTQVAQLTTAFKSLMSALGGSAGSPSLSLQRVLEGMLQTVQQQTAPAELGQLVDTFA